VECVYVRHPEGSPWLGNGHLKAGFADAQGGSVNGLGRANSWGVMGSPATRRGAAPAFSKLYDFCSQTDSSSIRSSSPVQHLPTPKLHCGASNDPLNELRSDLVDGTGDAQVSSSPRARRRRVEASQLVPSAGQDGVLTAFITDQQRADGVPCFKPSMAPDGALTSRPRIARKKTPLLRGPHSENGRFTLAHDRWRPARGASRLCFTS